MLFPLKSKTAEEESYMLQERVLAYLGPPKIFHSDNGREFVQQSDSYCVELRSGMVM